MEISAEMGIAILNISRGIIDERRIPYAEAQRLIEKIKHPDAPAKGQGVKEVFTVGNIGEDDGMSF